MKGKIRKIISLALMAVMLFGCFGITGCQDNTVQLQAQIDALQAELEQQAGKMQTLESEKEELNETITQLETENKSLMDRVEKLEWNDQIQKGAFYSLQEAYEKGFLTREDLRHIAYFKDGKLEELRGETIVSVEFTPKTPKPMLDEKTEEYLKRAYYQKNEKLFKSIEKYGYSISDIIFTIYLGKYNDCYVVEMKSPIIDTDCGIYQYSVGNIMFDWWGDNCYIEVWRENDYETY